MIINQKIRLLLSQKDEYTLNSQSKMCNKLYNKLVNEFNISKEKGVTKNYNSISILLKEMHKIKNKHAYFNCLHESTSKNIVFRLRRDYDYAIKKNYKKLKFKSFFKHWFTLFYDLESNGISIKGKTVNIKIGFVLDKNNNKKRASITGKLGERINLINNTGRVLHYKITKKYGFYYLVVCIKYNQQYKFIPITGKKIAIDPNHTNFFVGFDNTGKSIEFKNLFQLKYFDKNIDIVKSKRDKCKRESALKKYNSGKTYYQPSKRWLRLDNALTKLFHKRYEQVKIVLYTIANYLVNEYDEIAIGNYTPNSKFIKNKNMNHKMLYESVISKFRDILEYTCLKNNKKYILVNEAYTTQECHNCGYIKYINPDVRDITCPNCGKKYKRDINSAINIGKKAKILSNSDYENIDLSVFSYTASYNLQKQTISYCH
ncbi:MAG: transposase [Sphaerochaetaceae bacterium]|nr:transposase [Sphaerochaetaceae bacterium]